MMQNRRPFIAGNWKMNLTVPQAVALAAEVRRLTERLRSVDVGVFPSALAVHPVAARLDGSRLIVGAQNVYAKGFGAFTGENSADMLVSAGAAWALIGHSERRHLFGETIEDTRCKLAGLTGAAFRLVGPVYGQEVGLRPDLQRGLLALGAVFLGLARAFGPHPVEHELLVLVGQIGSLDPDVHDLDPQRSRGLPCLVSHLQHDLCAKA